MDFVSYFGHERCQIPAKLSDEFLKKSKGYGPTGSGIFKTIFSVKTAKLNMRACS
jgi:hypothetical protein